MEKGPKREFRKTKQHQDTKVDKNEKDIDLHEKEQRRSFTTERKEKKQRKQIPKRQNDLVGEENKTKRIKKYRQNDKDKQNKKKRQKTKKTKIKKMKSKIKKFKIKMMTREKIKNEKGANGDGEKNKGREDADT